MLSFVTIGIGNGALGHRGYEYKSWDFDSVEDLRAAYNDRRGDLPEDDEPIASMEFHGVPMYVDTFANIIDLFGIDN